MGSPATGGRPSTSLTVADALAHEQVRRWHPHVVSGHDHLDRPVRWAHVAETVDIGQMLIGDELVLTTGILLKGDEQLQRRYVEQLVAADVAGLVLGLGRAFHDVPPEVARGAKAAGLPFVVFRGPVPFVQLTEIIQLRLLEARSSAAIASEELRDRLLPAVARGAALAELAETLAGILECSVIVESVSGSVLAAGGDGVDDMLRDWVRLSSQTSAGRAAGVVRHPSGSVTAPLVSRGTRWGRLVLIPGPVLPRHPDVLAARAAEILGLHHVVSLGSASSELEQADALLGHLLAGSLAPDRLRVLARVSGLPSGGGRTLVPLIVGVMAPVETPDVRRSIRAGIEGVRAERRLAGLVGRLRAGRVPVVLSLASREDTDRALVAFAEAVHERSVASGYQVTVAAGPACERLEDLTTGFSTAAHAAEAFDLDPQGPRLVRLEDIRLGGLVRLLADNEDLKSFASRQLGALVARPDLLSVLSLYLATSMNKVATAQLSHLSRPALYRRLDQITELLDVDLNDIEQVSALYVALLAHRAQQRPVVGSP